MYHSGQVRFHEDLTPLMQDIDSVRQHPENYNNGDTDAIIESIRTIGMYRPIYVERETGYILAGNHTWQACKELGAHSIPVIYLDSRGVESLKAMIGDNHIANLARPDDAALLRLLDHLAVEDTLFGTGFTEDSVESLRLLQEKLQETGFGGSPEPEVPESRHCPACGYDLTGE